MNFREKSRLFERCVWNWLGGQNPSILSVQMKWWYITKNWNVSLKALSVSNCGPDATYPSFFFFLVHVESCVKVLVHCIKTCVIRLMLVVYCRKWSIWILLGTCIVRSNAISVFFWNKDWSYYLVLQISCTEKAAEQTTFEANQLAQFPIVKSVQHYSNPHCPVKSLCNIHYCLL